MAVNVRDWETHEPEDEPRLSELPIEWGEEIEPRLNSLWLVKRTLPQQGLALLYGHPGSGKSFLAIDIAMHVALGRDWNGCQTRKGVVVYVAAEGQNGLRNRVAAFRRHHSLAGSLPLALIPVPVDLHDPVVDRSKLVRAVRKACERYGDAPALIVLDTISKTLGAGKENTDDLAVYVANCGSLATEFGCCVLPVHHRPKDTESTEPRGHGSLKAGVDTVILVEAGRVKRARITKQKDGEERELVMFTLQPVELGVDDEGDTVTSCVVVPTLTDLGGGASNKFQQKINALSPNHKIIFDQLGKALEVDGVSPSDAIPDDVLDRNRIGKVVSLRTLSDRAISTLRTVTDTDPDTPRRTFDRAKKALQAKGIIAVWEEWAWIAY